LWTKSGSRMLLGFNKHTFMSFCIVTWVKVAALLRSFWISDPFWRGFWRRVLDGVFRVCSLSLVVVDRQLRFSISKKNSGLGSWKILRVFLFPHRYSRKKLSLERAEGRQGGLWGDGGNPIQED
jgi:hypothetical protein